MKLKDNQFSIVRIYKHPVGRVWSAFTEEAHQKHWWGPRGFSITTESKDLRTGGQWIYTMHGPDGTDYPNITTYHEVIPLKRLVYDHGASPGRPPLFRVEANFIDLGASTRYEMIMTLETAEAAREIQKFIKQVGGDSTWDRFSEYLEESSSGKKQFVINRSFSCGIDKMFKVWTQPEQFSKWLAPVGFDMSFIKADVREGGVSFYKMSNEATANPAVTMYGKVYYQEIQSPDRLLYIQEFCDSEGKLSRHPMLPTYPARVQTLVEFAVEGENKTRVTVTWEPVGEVTPEELAVFVSIRSGMTQGWTGSFNKLEEFLASL